MNTQERRKRNSTEKRTLKRRRSSFVAGIQELVVTEIEQDITFPSGSRTFLCPFCKKKTPEMTMLHLNDKIEDRVMFECCGRNIQFGRRNKAKNAMMHRWMAIVKEDKK